MFVATDLRLGRPVAIKVLAADVRDPRARERFEREARMLSSFAHPNAVAIFDAGFDAELAYFVMEFVDGPTLASYLERRGRLPVDDAISIADQVLAALDAAHSHGIVHRDVKPSNILLDSDGSVRLADFGIAKSIREVTGDLTATGQVVGTASYLAPELGRGESATPSSDLYAVGIIIFEMLTGEVPMRGENAVATLALRQHALMPSLRSDRPDVPGSLAAAVATALSPDPANRFASAREMRTAIRSHHATTTAPTEAEATSPYRPAVTPRREAGRAGRHRRLVGIGAVLAVLAVAAAVLLGIGAADHGTPSAQSSTSTTDSVANAAPPTSGPSTTVASPPTTTPAPRSLTELIALLSTPGNRFGIQQHALRARLLALIDHGRKQQGRNASALSRDVTRWASTGQLDPAIANDTVALLAAVRQEQPPTRQPPKHEDGPQNSDSQS